MSDAPRWPGADGGPGLDFSLDRGVKGGELYRDGDASSSASPARAEAGSPASPSSRDDRDHESAAETTSISGSSDRSQSAVEWASRPLGTAVPAPVRPAARSASSASSSASAPVAARSAESADRASTDAPMTPRAGSRRTRKARLRLARVDPWSVMKTTFLFSIGFGVMLIVIVYVLWAIILGSGALEAVDSFLTTLVGDQTGGEFRVQDYIGGSRIVGFAAVLAAIDVVIITAVSTLFAFLYNLAATIMGGLEVTLAED